LSAPVAAKGECSAYQQTSVKRATRGVEKPKSEQTSFPALNSFDDKHVRNFDDTSIGNEQRLPLAGAMISLSPTTGYAIYPVCYLEFQRGQSSLLHEIESALRTCTRADTATVAKAQGWPTARPAGTGSTIMPDAGKHEVRTPEQARVEPGLRSRFPARTGGSGHEAMVSAGRTDFGGGRISGCAALANHLKVAAPGRRSEGNQIPT
jgi:hypothetical protein